jgi:hypothetical protein
MVDTYLDTYHPTLDSYQPTTREHELAGALRCATLGHAWFDVDSTWKPSFGVPLTVRCERCGRERRDTLNAYGEVAARHYWPRKPKLTYQKGHRPSRSEFRRMLLAQRLAESREARRSSAS